jgi:hypothetical protein
MFKRGPARTIPGIAALGPRARVGRGLDGWAPWCATLVVFIGAASAAWADVGTLSQGTLVGWGRNTNGECNVPTGYFVQVSAGGESGLALRSDGNVVAWGSNADHQCNVPAGNYLQVSASQGGTSSLALRADGNIVAWGYNGDGECNVPTGSFVQLAAGSAHGLAIRTNGTLAAWGYNQYGESNAPAGSNYTQVAGGLFHSLALRSDGNIVAWGYNVHGECNVPSGSYTQVAAGFAHSLALRSNGTLAAWGDNGDGECNVPTGNTFTQVSAGDFHSLALRRDGTVAAWGYNAYGECNVPSGFYLAVSGGWGYSLGLKARTDYQDLLVSGAGAAALLDRSISVSGNATIQTTMNMANNPAMSVGGKVQILSAGTLNLQGGTLVSIPDANKGVTIQNDGLLHVSGGSYHVGAVTTSDPNILHGTTIIDANATLWVSSLFQDTLVVNGTLVLGGPSTGGTLAPAISDGAAWADTSPLASGTVPEPACLALLALGAAAMIRHKR